MTKPKTPVAKKVIPHSKSALAEAIALSIQRPSEEVSRKDFSLFEIKSVGVQSIRAQIARSVEEGDHSVTVIETLYDGETFLPTEGYLFDYKRGWPESKAELAKYVRHVAAFHNVFGGLIFFGVDEVEKDKVFKPCAPAEPAIDVKQFKDVIREFLIYPVEITLQSHWVTSKTGERFSVTVLHVPKRAPLAEPNAIRKDLHSDSGKFVLKANEIYLRDGDNSLPAQHQHHWKTLYSARQNPYLEVPQHSDVLRVLENNLPDRSLIYGEFVGRTNELEQLWRWFSDDFSRVRVLAGEGGLGKTSIAYEFASDVCRTAPVGFDCVIWLTAKKKQFRALENSFEELGLEVFETTAELLRQMGAAMGLSDSELAECPEPLLPRMVKQASANIAALVVVDDLDSLDLDEQKRSIEVCQQFSTTKSRFLFTTRKNVTASSASSIEVSGFDSGEFGQFIDVWNKRLSLRALSSGETKSLLATTGGSPLFTESILRLLRSGLQLSEALKLWKGHLGIEVRNAALKREVMQLRMEARKVLAVVTTLGSCSFSEIKLLSGFTEQTVLDAANELQSLFLLSTPPIAKEARFAVSETTRLLVRSLGTELLPNFSELVKDVLEKKYKSLGEGRRTSLRSVASAIHQAMAQMADNRPDDAVKTVEEVNKQLGGKNADLLSVRARALAVSEGKSPSLVRKAFEAAYDAGQRKEVFFDHWYRAEVKAKNWDGAIQVVDRALQVDAERPGFWILKRLDARLEAATNHRTSDVEHATNQVKAAMRDLQLLSNCRDVNTTVDRLHIRRSLEGFADLHWELPRQSADFGQWLDALERQLDAVGLGDKRYETYIRAAVAFVGLRAATAGDASKSVVTQMLRLLLSAFNSAPHSVSRIPQFHAAHMELKQIPAA